MLQNNGNWKEHILSYDHEYVVCQHERGTQKGAKRVSDPWGWSCVPPTVGMRNKTLGYQERLAFLNLPGRLSAHELQFPNIENIQRINCEQK